MMMGTTDSIVEAVRDPALPMVYLGMIFLVIGSFVTFWVPKRREETVFGTTSPADDAAADTPEVKELV